ncbi:MAG: hypothetical protein GVY34_07165 [Alphaproteobacteria bacterium]|jgi:hypothetical protein|nr:hypothetical protein [Alphaproteobacteria bacterium]
MRFRFALLTLMMVLMLPLGALNAWVPSMAGQTTPSAQMAATNGVQSQTTRSCRSGFLPGAGCAKFLDGSVEKTMGGPNSQAPAAPRHTAARTQTRPAPPQGPPRNV